MFKNPASNAMMRTISQVDWVQVNAYLGQMEVRGQGPLAGLAGRCRRLMSKQHQVASVVALMQYGTQHLSAVHVNKTATRKWGNAGLHLVVAITR